MSNKYQTAARMQPRLEHEIPTLVQNAREIIDLLSQMKQELGITIVTATHDMKMLSRSDTIVRIENGSVAEVSTSDQFQVTIGTIDGSDVL